MREFIDLHTHSLCSDGSVSPAEVARMANEANLAACALTDHDTIEGIPEFMATGEKYPELKLYSGVELSSSHHGREIHIVGIGVDWHSDSLSEFLGWMREERLKRAELMAARLSKLGYPLPDNWRELKVIGRMHFAELLLDNYPFSTLNEVFEKLLRRNTPGYVPRNLPTPAEAIRQIHAAGGAAIWAHPVYAQPRERHWGKSILRYLGPAGLDGIEGYYTTFSPEQTKVVMELAGNNSLFISGGSDYHGSGHAGVQVGRGFGNLQVPAALLSNIDKAIERVRSGNFA